MLLVTLGCSGMICIDIGQKPMIIFEAEDLMEKTIELISKISVFNGLSPAQLEDVRQIADYRNFSKNETIFRIYLLSLSFYLTLFKNLMVKLIKKYF